MGNFQSVESQKSDHLNMSFYTLNALDTVFSGNHHGRESDNSAKQKAGDQMFQVSSEVL